MEVLASNGLTWAPEAALLEGAPGQGPLERLPLTLPHSPEAPGLGCLRPNKSLGGSTVPPISRKLDSSFTEQGPAQSRTQFIPLGSLHKYLSLIHQKADGRRKKNHNPTAAKKENHVS